MGVYLSVVRPLDCGIFLLLVYWIVVSFCCYFTGLWYLSVVSLLDCGTSLLLVYWIVVSFSC